MYQCKPLPTTTIFMPHMAADAGLVPCARGLHSSTSQLNVSAFVWDRGRIQGLVRGCLEGHSIVFGV